MTLMTGSNWPPELPAVQVRFARQTDQLDAIRRFYSDGLGLPVIGEFKGHAGYDGLFVGLPGTAYHLEWVQHADGSPGTAPNQESLIVLYIPDATVVTTMADRLEAMGYQRVPSANPYWDDHGAITILDPDGWGVVLQPGNGLL